MSTLVLTVPDVSCAQCEQALTGALRPLAGVQAVAVDLPGTTVTLQHGAAFRVDAALAAVEDAGYAVAAVEERS